MNYKILFPILIMVLNVCFASDQEAVALKIEQLKNKQFEIDTDMVELRDKVEKETYKYREYLTLCSSMWKTDYDQYKELSWKLGSVIKEGGDIEKFFEEQAPYVKNAGDVFWIVFLTYQYLRLANSVDLFMYRVEDLLEVNRELHLLQQQ